MLAESSIMHSHYVLSRLRLFKVESCVCFTGSVRISNDGFAMDIFLFGGLEACLKKAPLCSHIVFYRVLGVVRGEALSASEKCSHQR